MGRTLFLAPGWPNEARHAIFRAYEASIGLPVTTRDFRMIFAIRAFFLATLTTAPLLAACSSQEGNAETQGMGADSVVQAILGSAAANQPPPSFSPRLSAGDQEARPLDISQMGYNWGDTDAPVRVMEISDFGCGFCRRFHEETFPSLVESYVETGMVQWKFLPFVLGKFPNGLEAALAGECGGEQGQFFVMQDRLFSDQSGWRGSSDPFPFFAQIAEEEGLDVSRYNRCVEGGWREGALRNNIRLGQEIGVRGTPTFLIDGVPVSGALPLDTFRDILDIALTQKGITPPERG
jgi:protein-disulfide isomerase